MEPGRGTGAEPSPTVGNNGHERRDAAERDPASDAVAWAVSHLSEREAVFSRTGLPAGRAP